ncbi:di-trans,poly-cis-decaprenylcistransferase [Candidatus Woesearchaeota archaeon]|nr:di-trans,poly-cis-decaprenylcistransferase [Candidatus Woesearchaeota archaeon]
MNSTNVPRHIGIILDGNRRFSKRLMLKPWMGHEWGAKKVEKVFDWCQELGIREITLYCFSMQNFDRPKQEFDFLMNVFRENFEKLKTDPRLEQNGIRLNFIGRIHLFPAEIQASMRHLMEQTKNHDQHIINFAMAYGGREEVIDAVKKIGEQIKRGDVDVANINEEVFSKNLYMDHEPDLIIRTGGDCRTSNFLIWQSWYSEWFFLEKTWPEFEKEDLINVVNEFGSRQRRFGK